MAADSVHHHAQQSLEPLAHSQATSAGTQHTHDSSEQGKVNHEASVSEQIETPTAIMLPVELLLEIFAELNTADVHVVTQVCRTWRAVANGDARLWRKLGFSPAFDRRARVDPLFAQAQLSAAVEQADDKVTSVDMSNLPCHAIVTLCEMLYWSAETLRHILWSPLSSLSDAAEDVYQLAKRCPQLQTLELRSAHQNWGLREKFTQHAWGGLRLSSFSISVVSLVDEWPSEPMPMIYDEAREVSMAVETDATSGCCEIALDSLLKDKLGLERLALYGIWQDVDFYRKRLDVPALKHLVIRERDFCDMEDDYENHPDLEYKPPMIDAPRLRELVVDARLLSNFTSDSIAKLDSLVLCIGARRYNHPTREWASLDRIKHHQGRLTLFVAVDGAPQTLAILSSGFLWHQLEMVDIELGEGSAGALVRIIAARQAGARGASKEQYMSLLQEAPSQRMTGTPSDNRQRRLTSNLGLTPKRLDSADITTFTSSIQIDTTNPPLCSEVTWRIKASAKVPVGVIHWLRAQSNVQLE